MQNHEQENNDRIDFAEAVILAAGGAVSGIGQSHIEMPVKHRFTPGMYIREIFMPAGSILTSKIHKTEHPFVVAMGAALVYSDNDGPQCIEAPHVGVTRTFTRRFIVVLKDTVWITFHPTNLTDVELIEKEIIEPHQNELIVGFIRVEGE
jgi:hypothetical protein